MFVVVPETLPQLPAYTVVSTVDPFRGCAYPEDRAFAADLTEKLAGTDRMPHVPKVSTLPLSDVPL